MKSDTSTVEILSMSSQSPETPDVKRLDYGVGFAIGWLIFTVVVSVGLGPQLGLRGWAWLGLHRVIVSSDVPMNFDVAGGVGVGNYRWDHRTKAFWSVLCYIPPHHARLGEQMRLDGWAYGRYRLVYGLVIRQKTVSVMKRVPLMKNRNRQHRTNPKFQR